MNNRGTPFIRRGRINPCTTFSIISDPLQQSSDEPPVQDDVVTDSLQSSSTEPPVQDDVVLDNDEPICRFCRENVDVTHSSVLSPCLCKGTSKYVHATCLAESLNAKGHQASNYAYAGDCAFDIVNRCDICNSRIVIPHDIRKTKPTFFIRNIVYPVYKLHVTFQLDLVDALLLYSVLAYFLYFTVVFPMYSPLWTLMIYIHILRVSTTVILTDRNYDINDDINLMQCNTIVDACYKYVKIQKKFCKLFLYAFTVSYVTCVCIYKVFEKFFQERQFFDDKYTEDVSIVSVLLLGWVLSYLRSREKAQYTHTRQLRRQPELNTEFLDIDQYDIPEFIAEYVTPKYV